MKYGKVWLVGAGPGDAGLLTLKGKEVLEQADVVVYDALVSPQILNIIPENVRSVFAGKRAGHHFLKQEETNLLLMQEAMNGKNVVRLKGGDPFLFGRGGEELELLIQHSIPYEIVPGITSALAVPAYQGIPVTHRDYCSSVHIITGHKRNGHTYDIDFSALVKTKGTLIFLMGVAALADICEGLLKADMDPKTPATVLSKGTTAHQTRIIATLETLPERCRNRTIPTPAVIVVGNVCELAEKFAWYEKRPLAGMRILVTRPRKRASRLAYMLRQEGAEVLEIPSITLISKMNDIKVQTAVNSLKNGQYDWLVFTSPSGVQIFMDSYLKTNDVRTLSDVKIAVIGQGSATELQKYGIRADFIPSVYDGETLGKELAELISENSKILIPRAKVGNRELTEQLLKKCKAGVNDIPIYETTYTNSAGVQTEDGFDYVMFTSASTVHGFVQLFKDMEFQQINAVCIGQQTCAVAKKYGMNTVTAEAATLESMIEILKATVKERFEK